MKNDYREKAEILSKILAALALLPQQHPRSVSTDEGFFGLIPLATWLMLKQLRKKKLTLPFTPRR